MYRFLLAKLYMDAITAQLSPYNVRKELEELPENLQEFYRITMGRIEAQDKTKRDYAIRILSWIVWASRPLLVEEMLHALAVEEGDIEIQESRMLRRENLQEFCCGLVVIDEANTVGLVHYTAQNYFAVNKGAEFLDFRCRIASTCASYLCILSIKRPDVLLMDKHKDYPFARYAGEYLDRHIREIRNETVSTKIAQTIRQLLENQHQSDFYHNFLHRLGIYYCITQDPLEKRLKLNWLKSLLQKMGAIYVPDHPGQELPLSPWITTKLHLAVFLGCTHLVYEYIQSGMDVDALDQFGNSAIVIACEKSDDEIITILMEHGVHVDLTTESGHSFLLHAARRDLWGTVQSILREASGREYKSATGPSQAHNNQAGSSPPRREPYQGLNPRTKPPVSKRHPPRKLRRYTGFLIAAYNGDTATITELVKHGKVDLSTRSTRTPLKPKWARFTTTACFLAVERCHVETVRKLLEYQIDPGTRGFDFCTLLHRAMERNDVGITKLLLERNASLRVNNASATPDRAKGKQANTLR